MTDPIKINGYILSEGITVQSQVASWIENQTPLVLQHMDRGDDLTPLLNPDRPNDKRLGRIEIFQGLMEEYEKQIEESMRAGRGHHWGKWEAALKQKDKIAEMVQELGWDPAFHVSDRAYHRRIVFLSLKILLTDEKQLIKFYKAGLSSWEAGGLCFNYPSNHVKSPHEFTAEQTVIACKRKDVTRWGNCTATARKVVTLMTSAFAIYRPGNNTLRWINIRQIPSSKVGHAFIAFHTKNQWQVFDPSNIGFKYFFFGNYEMADIWRGSLLDYYINRSIGLIKQNKFSEAEIAIKKGLEINPTSSHLLSLNAFSHPLYPELPLKRPTWVQ